jgi:acetoin utilization deacetylase AcuC-like enzyme
VPLRDKTQDRIVTSDELRVTSEIPPNPPLEKGGNCVFPLEKEENCVFPLEKEGNIPCLESGVLSPGSSKIAFVYSDRIHADIGDHVFPIEKYGLVRQRLIDDGVLNPEDFVEPQMATTEDLLLVHTKDYVHDLTKMIWTERTIRSELPLTEDIKNSYLLGTGGTILACQRALSSRVAVNLSGGFHHAFPDHAEGFCYTNDVAIAVRRLQRDNQVSRFFIVDCDLHQGNGTAYIFRADSDVFTFSIHQENNYPLKQKSDLDIGLADGADDAIYLAHLQEYVPSILDEFAPGFVIYLAGADPYQDDQLGGLDLTMDGLQHRDEFVIGECLSRSIPVAVLLAGGYAVNTDDTVTIHCNTCKVAYNLWHVMVGA